MLLNILFNYYNDTVHNSKIFNKILLIGFVFYSFIYMLFGSLAILIYITDSTYLLKRYIETKKNGYSYNEIKNNKSNKSILINKSKNLVDTIVVPNINITDPEFKKELYLPYKHNLKDTFIQLSNNIV